MTGTKKPCNYVKALSYQDIVILLQLTLLPTSTYNKFISFSEVKISGVYQPGRDIGTALAKSVWSRCPQEINMMRIFLQLRVEKSPINKFAKKQSCGGRRPVGGNKVKNHLANGSHVTLCFICRVRTEDQFIGRSATFPIEYLLFAAPLMWK